MGWPIDTAPGHFELVVASELPPPHNPFRCAHEARFARLEDAGPHDSPGTPTREATLAAGRAFDRALGAAELAGDRYHRADWRAIAALACGFIEVEDPERSYDELARRAGAGGLDAEEQSWLRSPFVHPIVWANGSLELTNGQHRSCALCHSGAQRCPVVRH